MSLYRVYRVGMDGHFIDAITLDCADDEAALQSAKQLADGRGMELWHQKRIVAAFLTDGTINIRADWGA